MQDRECEVGEWWADEEVCAPVEEFLSGESGVVANFGDADFDWTAVNATGAVGQFGDVGHEVGAGDVDEADNVGEVHRHADLDGVTGGCIGAVVEVGAEDAVDVDRAATEVATAAA